MVESNVALEAVVDGEAKNTVPHPELRSGGRSNVLESAGHVLAQDDWVLDEGQRLVLKHSVAWVHGPSMNPE